MPIELKTGETYSAVRARSGDNYELVVVQEEGKGRKQITIWPTNSPSGVTEGGSFRVDAIQSVKFTSRKDPRGNWRDEVNVNARITPTMSYPAYKAQNVQPDAGFDEIPDDSFGELPLPF